MIKGLKPNLKRLNSPKPSNSKKLAAAKLVLKKLKETEYPTVILKRKIDGPAFRRLLDKNENDSIQDFNLLAWYKEEWNDTNESIDFYLTALTFYAGRAGREKEASHCYSKVRWWIKYSMDSLEEEIANISGLQPKSKQ